MENAYLAVLCGIFLAVVVGLRVPFIFLVVSKRLRDSEREPWSGAIKAASYATIGATIVSLQFGYNFPGGFLQTGGIARGYPLTWWGMQVTGYGIVAAPITLVLDLWFWFILAFIVLLPIRWAVLKTFPYPSTFVWVLFAGGLFCLVPFLVQYIDPNAKTVQALEARQAQQRQEWQTQYDARIRRDAPLANNAIQFIGCRDELVPSEKYTGIKTLRVHVTFQVFNKSAYQFIATSRDFSTRQVSHERHELGEGTAIFDFTPGIFTVGSQIEQGMRKDGPYSIDVKLDFIDTLAGSSFSQPDIKRAQELGVLDPAAFSFTCTTAAYKATDFGPPIGTFPRTPTPIRTPTR